MNFILLSLAYLVLDFSWITIMTPIVYKKTFESIQKSRLLFNTPYAILAYMTLLYTLYYICRPLSRTFNSYKWFAYTSVGFVIYAIYNFTNAAVFTEYSSKMIILDILWGTIVFTLLGLFDL